MELNSIIAIISANTIVLAILAFLTKSIVTHWLNKDVEKFKSDVEHAARKSLSVIQSELEKERIRLQVSYGNIFGKQAEIIIEIFKLLTNFESNINNALYDRGDQEYYKNFFESWSVLHNFFSINRILLPKALDQLIDKFQNDIFFGVDQYRRLAKRIDKGNIDATQLENIFSKQDAVVNELENIKKLKEELTYQLRLIIGISE